METTPTSEPRESTIMCVWPSISALPIGQFLGRLYQLGPRVSLLRIPFRPGWLIALATVPVALFLYFNKIVPRIPFVLFGLRNPWCRRYRLTTERVVAENPFDALSAKRSGGAVKASVDLTGFDAIELDQQPGQDWYRAADLVFILDGNEVLRLPGVPHAEAFRQTCLKAQLSHPNRPANASSAPSPAL